MSFTHIARCLLWILALTLLIGTTTGFVSLLATSSEDTPSVAERESSTALLSSSAITCLGYVDVENGITSLSPARPGCIVEIVAREGEAVRAGSVLLRIDDRSARYARQQAQAMRDAAGVRLAQAREALRKYPVQLAQQEAALDAARARLAAARHMQTEKEKLLKSKLISDWEFAVTREQIKELEALCRAEEEKLAELRLHDAELAVRSAQAEAAASQARLEEAEYALEECVLKAPEAGTVLRVLVGRGTVVNGGAGQPAIQFRPDRPLVVRAEVEQEFVGRIAVGQAAVVEDEFQAGGPWRGRVLRIADWHSQHRALLQQPPRFTDVPTVECLITLDPDCPRLRLGQRVRVTIGPAAP